MNIDGIINEIAVTFKSSISGLKITQTGNTTGVIFKCNDSFDFCEDSTKVRNIVKDAIENEATLQLNFNFEDQTIELIQE